MKVDLTRKLFTIKGEVIKEQIITADSQVLNTDIDAKVSDLLVRALTSSNEKDDKTHKEKDYKLTIKILTNKKDVLDLESDEIVRLKTKISEVFPTWIMGQLFDILEGKEPLKF